MIGFIKFAAHCGGGEPACRQAGLVVAYFEVVVPIIGRDKLDLIDIILNMYYVYAIKSLTRIYIYVGLTDNIERRIGQHNKGQNRSTKAYKPFKLIYTEAFETRKEAREKEIYLKSGIGKEFLKPLK